MPRAMPHLVLFQPDIPQNAGTMLRLCACLGVGAGIVEPAGFPVSDRHFRRAGLDYLEGLRLERHASFEAFETWRHAGAGRLVLLTTRGETDYLDLDYRPDDVLMVGRESAGLPEVVHERADARVRIAMQPAMRSLNVAIAAAMVLGEALRQLRRTAKMPLEGERSP
jgi:tRNA (cytidine/uridine-2'-O-)-methyltransferase